MMSLSLAYCLVIAPINILLKSLKTSGSSRSILSSPSDSEITSGRIDLESNELHKRTVEWSNIWINGAPACRKVLKLSNIRIIDWTNIAWNLLTGLFECIYQSLFSTRFVIWIFLVWSSSKLKLDRKCNSKESHYIIVLSKHFSRLNHVLETRLITFLTLLLLKFMDSLSLFSSFSTPAKKIVYDNKTFSIYRKFFGTLSRTQKCKWQGQPTSEIFWSLAHFVFSEGGCYVVQSQNFYQLKNTLHNYSSLMKLLLLLHCTYHTFVVLLNHC